MASRAPFSKYEEFSKKEENQGYAFQKSFSLPLWLHVLIIRTNFS